MSAQNADYVQGCIAHKEERGQQLRCIRPHHHHGNHRWEVDRNFYPFGRLDPDDPIDQAIVRAFNRGVAAQKDGSGAPVDTKDTP